MFGYVRILKDRLRVSVLSALAIVFSVSTVSAQQSLDGSRPEVTYDNRADAVVVEYFVNVGEIADEIEDAQARVRIYGDGVTVVHIPTYMKRSGDYSVTLSPAELQGLMDSLAERGVFDFDAEAAESALQHAKFVRANEARRGGPAPTVVSDDATTTLRVRALTYRAPGATSTLRNVTKEIVWYGLQSDAREYPSVAGLADLAATVADIAAIAQRTDLMPLP